MFRYFGRRRERVRNENDFAPKLITLKLIPESSELYSTQLKETNGGGGGGGEVTEKKRRARGERGKRDRTGDVEKREAERKALHDVFLRLAAGRRKLF